MDINIQYYYEYTYIIEIMNFNNCENYMVSIIKKLKEKVEN